MNIESSTSSLSRKKELIDYAQALFEKKVPVFFDSIHLLSTLTIEPSVNLEEYIQNEVVTYEIRKRSGEVRVVCSPNYTLKQIQRWILNEILSKQNISKYTHGFVKNRSILTNAETHIHSQDFWVLSIDIIDFFSSVTYDSVFNIFIDIGYNYEVSEALTKLCTFERKLAQGFPTSPSIANLYLRQFDEMIATYAETLDSDIKYTRYADDLTFSGVKKRGYTKFVSKLVKKIEAELMNYNLLINNKKTRLQKKEIKRITGLNVSKQGVSISKSYSKKLEQTIYYCYKYGVVDHLKYHEKENISNFKGYLYGQASFIKMINPSEGNFLIEKLNKLDWE